MVTVCIEETAGFGIIDEGKQCSTISEDLLPHLPHRKFICPIRNGSWVESCNHVASDTAEVVEFKLAIAMVQLEVREGMVATRKVSAQMAVNQWNTYMDQLNFNFIANEVASEDKKHSIFLWDDMCKLDLTYSIQTYHRRWSLNNETEGWWW